jgi:hypothetical protein
LQETGRCKEAVINAVKVFCLWEEKAMPEKPARIQTPFRERTLLSSAHYL